MFSLSKKSVVSILRNWKKLTSIAVILVSLVILFIAHMEDTCEVNATIPIRTPFQPDPVEAGLEGKLSLYGFKVEAGVEGGVVGEGMTVKNDRFFVQGPGPELPDRLGLIMNSYKETGHSLKYRTRYDPVEKKDCGGMIEVTSRIDRIPFWLDGLREDITITVSLNDTWKLEKAEISKVWIEVWYDYDDEENEYRSKRVVWEKKVTDVLRSENETLEYSHRMIYETDYERIGIVARVRSKVTDTEGNSDDKPDLPFSSDGYPHPHNVYLATRSEGGRAVLLVLAFPMFIIAGLLCVLAIIFVFIDDSRAAGLVLTAGILIGAGFFFYWWGVVTILEMTEVSSALEMMTEKYFEWKWPLFILMPSSVLLIGNSVFMWTAKVVEKKDISKVECDPKEGSGGKDTGKEKTE